MEAIDYFKKYGLKGSREHLDWMVRVGARRDIHGWFMDDLKRIVESHELVESYGGLDQAKSKLDYFDWMPMGGNNHVLLSKAIIDVESCQ